jgi:hypothetical protein
MSPGGSPPDAGPPSAWWAVLALALIFGAGLIFT